MHSHVVKHSLGVFQQQVELSVRVATLLLRLHQQQIVGSGLARATLVKLHAVLHRQVKVRRFGPQDACALRA